MTNIRRWFLYLLDIIFITSLVSIFFILITGGVRIEFIEIDLISLKRPLLFLVTSFLLRKLFYRGISYREGPIGKLLFFIEGYPSRKIKIYMFLITILFFPLISSKIISRSWPTGDEPHFLMITFSLAKDGDINLRNNYDNGDYYEFFPMRLYPHSRIQEADKIYSAHGAGLPILILPGYILASRYGARYTIGILFALLSVVIFSLSYQVTKNKIISIGLTFLMSFTVPLVFYSFQIYTELPAALIVAYLFLFCLATGGKHPAIKLIFVGFLLACLPWLHVRYLIFTAIIFIYLCYKMIPYPNPLPMGERVWMRGLRRILPIAGIIISSILLLLLYMKSLYGVASLSAQYRAINTGFSHLPKGLLGNFFDCRFGLFIYSPYYIFLGAGLYFFYKNNKSQFLWWSLVVVPFIISASSYYHWHGGCCPPLRYITPIIPLFIIPLGYLFVFCKNRLFYILFAIFVWLSFAAKKILSEGPWMLYHDEYAKSQFLELLEAKGINLWWLAAYLFGPTIKDYIKVAGWLVFLILLNYSVVQSFRRRIS